MWNKTIKMYDGNWCRDARNRARARTVIYCCLLSQFIKPTPHDSEKLVYDLCANDANITLYMFDVLIFVEFCGWTVHIVLPAIVFHIFGRNQ